MLYFFKPHIHDNDMSFCINITQRLRFVGQFYSCLPWASIKNLGHIPIRLSQLCFLRCRSTYFFWVESDRILVFCLKFHVFSTRIWVLPVVFSIKGDFPLAVWTPHGPRVIHWISHVFVSNIPGWRNIYNYRHIIYSSHMYIHTYMSYNLLWARDFLPRLGTRPPKPNSQSNRGSAAISPVCGGQSWAIIWLAYILLWMEDILHQLNRLFIPFIHRLSTTHFLTPQFLYVGWLVVWNMFFPYLGNNHPNRLSYFSEGRLNHQAVGQS